MLIAKQKRKENIAEYILYLYQVEDLIRAFQLDMDLIETRLISEYSADEKLFLEIKNWYENLVRMMEKEGIREKGHLQFLINQILELNDFHLKLMETGADQSYVQLFQIVAGLLSELKSKNNVAGNSVQLGLDTIYGYLLLKIQKKEISAETTDAVKRLSNWLHLLSKLFADYEANELIL